MVGDPKNCVTHHHACACREAAHRAEVDRLRRELEDMTRAANEADELACRWKQQAVELGWDGAERPLRPVEGWTPPHTLPSWAQGRRKAESGHKEEG